MYDVTPSIGNSLAGYIGSKITSSDKSNDLAKSSQRSWVREYKWG